MQCIEKQTEKDSKAGNKTQVMSVFRPLSFSARRFIFNSTKRLQSTVPDSIESFQY